MTRVQRIDMAVRDAVKAGGLSPTEAMDELTITRYTGESPRGAVLLSRIRLEFVKREG
jgi:hypothetical protein